MAGLKSYSVLKARAVDRRLGAGRSPHYQILCSDDASLYRIAVNVQSQLAPSELEYLVIDRFSHPLLNGLAELSSGLHSLDRKPGGMALDYIRGNLFDPAAMVPLPHSVPGPDNDLNEKIDHYVQRAMADEEAQVLAFGETWGPENDKRDKYFGFAPGRGIHDIHMNQGNVGRFVKDDGVWQDGGLIFHFPGQDQWTAVFLKFQSQAWHTDDATGHRLEVETAGPPSDLGATAVRPFALGALPTEDLPDGLIRIVAALVNSAQSPEKETVTLLNASNRAVALDGWRLRDSAKREQGLSGTIAPGATMLVPIRRPLELSNQGGLITLVNDAGLKVDGVSYSRQQARNPDWTIIF